MESNSAPSARYVQKSKLSAKYCFDDIIHSSAVMVETLNRCQKIARNDSSVMIFGETGTGKELFAQSIHNASRRANTPFLAINCAAIPANLLEGLLFGTEKGAYTGAERRSGLFEQADGGTLLLDELNSMDIALQSKLLRVLQDGTFCRVGGTTEIKVDVRVLSNINIHPHKAIEKRDLRKDLFYRLGVVQITVSPLQERTDDIALLVNHFIAHYNQVMSRNVHRLDAEVLNIFRRYNRPGNVRELQHAIEYVMNILPDEYNVITADYLPDHIRTFEAARAPAAAPQPSPLFQQAAAPVGYQEVYRTEAAIISQALLRTHGNVTAAARLLGVSRQTLQYRIKRSQIDVDALLHGSSGQHSAL